MEFAGTFCVVAEEVIRRRKRLEKKADSESQVQHTQKAKTTVMEKQAMKRLPKTGDHGMFFVMGNRWRDEGTGRSFTSSRSGEEEKMTSCWFFSKKKIRKVSRPSKEWLSRWGEKDGFRAAGRKERTEVAGDKVDGEERGASVRLFWFPVDRKREERRDWTSRGRWRN